MAGESVGSVAESEIKSVKLGFNRPIMDDTNFLQIVLTCLKSNWFPSDKKRDLFMGGNLIKRL